MQHRLTPLAAALALAFIVPMSFAGLVQAQTTSTPDATTTGTDAKAAALPTVTVSADASADGLPEAYAGGQVARGGRVGFLGNKDILDTPFSTTSYTQEFIKDQQAQGVGDILQSDPTVRVTRGFGNFQEMYIIRGMPLYSDDLAYNGLYGLLPRQYVSSELLERVEVLRGASAFLSGMTPGSSGLGGSINLLPKRASSDPITQVTVGMESGGQGYYAVDIGRRFGPEDRVGVRVNTVRREGGTSVDGENRELNLASVGVDYRGNDFRLSADFGFQEQRLINARPSVTLGSGVAVPSAPSASSNYGQSWAYSNERDQFGTVRGEWDLNSSTTAWAAYGMRHGIERNSLANPTVTNASTGAATTYRFDNARDDTVNTGEVGIRTKFATGPVKHELSATASIFVLDSKNSYAYGDSLNTNIYSPTSYSTPALTSVGGGDLANPRTTEHDELSSVAIADTASMFDDRLQVTLGARTQRVKQTGYYNYTTGAQTSYYNDSTTTPMAAVVYKVRKDLSVYASYVEGLQVGQNVTDIAASNYGQTLAPYKSKQKEIGIKYDAGKVGLTAALFTTSKPNIFKNTTTNYYGENGNQRNRGVEFTAFGTPVRGVRLLAGLTVMDAKQQSTDGGTTDGKYVIGVAKTQANTSVEYDIPGVQGLSVSARATYTGTQYVDAANTQQLPSWMRYDLGARYVTVIAGQAVTFRGRVDNVTNKGYWASSGGTYGYLVQGAARTFVLSAAIDF